MTSDNRKWKVLVSAPYILPVLDEYRSSIEDKGIEIIVANVNERLSEEELLPLVPEIDGIICGDDRFTQQVFRAAPNLKVISKWGTGIDSIDADAAESSGVRVYNTPGAFTDAVADTVLGYTLMFARKLVWLDRDMQSGQWKKRLGVTLGECSIGVIGVGAVGQAVVKRAVSFGMTVMGSDIAPVSESFITQSGIEMLPMDELLARADYVSLNCTLNPTSSHLISTRELGLMRDTAVLINTCRGPVVDEAALATALRQGDIAGAALDVFEDEPLPDNSPLRAMENCLLSPHNANSSPKAWQRVHENTIKNLMEGLNA